jgi:hypothetical protein
VRQIDVRQLVGNPSTLGKHLSRHERDLVVAQIELKNKCKIMFVKISKLQTRQNREIIIFRQLL